MTNKVVGYMVTVPTILFFVMFFSAVYYPSIAAAIDIQIYFVIGVVFFVGLLLSLFKLWNLPKPENQVIPVGNRGVIGWMLLIILATVIGQSVELGAQLETLLGLLLLVVVTVISYRLITAKKTTTKKEKEAPHHTDQEPGMKSSLTH